MNQPPKIESFPAMRNSASMNASQKAERERIAQMTVEERVKEALELQFQYRNLIAPKHP